MWTVKRNVKERGKQDEWNGWLKERRGEKEGEKENV